MELRDFLQSKHAMDVLLAVYKNPGIVQKELANKKEKGSTAKQDRIAEAIKLGLIRQEKSPNHWSALVYYITDEGERVCKLLLKIENKNSVSDLLATKESTFLKNEEQPESKDALDILNAEAGKILQTVYERQHPTFSELVKYTKLAEDKLQKDLDVLVSSGWVRTAGDQYFVTEEGARKARLVIALENGEDIQQIDYEEPAAGGTATKGSG